MRFISSSAAVLSSVAAGLLVGGVLAGTGSGAVAGTGSGPVAGTGSGAVAGTGQGTATTGQATVAQATGAGSLAGAAPVGDTPSATPITVTFALKARRLAALEDEVSQGWRGSYLSVRQFARLYGQPPGVISALRGYLGRFGISATVYPNGLDVTAHGTAGEFGQALSVRLQDYRVRRQFPALPGRWLSTTVYAATTPPTLPAALAAATESVAGLTDDAPFVSNAVPAPRPPAAGGPVAASPGGTVPIPAGERTPADFEQQYDLSPVERRGALGQGETIGIVTLAALDPATPETFWARYLGLSTRPGRIVIDNVDGGPGPVSLASGSLETTLDVEQSGAIAPQARIIVYQAPQTPSGLLDAFAAAATQDAADSVSSSWGGSETALKVDVLHGLIPASYLQSLDETFLEMAAQGQSGFVASGDSGAYEAVNVPATNLDVQFPADSPFITATGGTTLPGTLTLPLASGGTQSVTIPEQRTWGGDYLWPLYAALGFTSEEAAATSPALVGGSGGGFSDLEPRPLYQRGAIGTDVTRYSYYPYRTPADVTDAQGIPLPTAWLYTPAPPLDTGTEPVGRAEPDVSVDSDPLTGYAVYDPLLTAVYGSPVQQFGGTSFAAPQFAGTAAVLDGFLGHRTGFWNPALYRFASSAASPFTPVSSDVVFGSGFYYQTSASGTREPLAGRFASDNSYYTGTPGTRYNPGSGLGYPDLAALARRFAGIA